MKITHTRLRRIISEEISYVLGDDGIKYAKIPEEELRYEQFGNCGMIAIAMAQEAESRGMEGVRMVLVHDEGVNPLVIEDPQFPPNLYHVAVSIDGKYYDDRSIDRGAIPYDQLTVVGGEDLREYDPIEITEVELDEPGVENAIIQGTLANKCPADFRERAAAILDNATRQTVRAPG